MKIKLYTLLFQVFTCLAFSQVQKSNTLQIGNTSKNAISPSAGLQIDETARGFLPPRLTTTQRDSIFAPAKGLTIFNSTSDCLEWYTGVRWHNSCAYESSGGTAVVSSYSCSTVSSIKLTAKTATSGATQTITATVTNPGTYNVSTIPVNGVVFSGSGVFTTTGPQDIVLTATGIPIINGSTTFTLRTSPNCDFTKNISPLVNIPVVIPSSITLNQSSNYFVASAYDVNYLPLKAPTSIATMTSIDADDKNEEKPINLQGSISTTGVMVKIPVTATASGKLPEFSTTITIPSSATEDGFGRDLVLSWPSQEYTTSTKTITASILAVGGNLNVKKLDINSGIGNDYLGILIGSFIYPYNSTGSTTQFNIRAISLIPDRMAGIADKTGDKTSHLMFYAPIVAEDGKIWLNNNLGAQYSNINHPSFNPIQQATSAVDFNAYASLFQWGRKPDGHELITWTAGTPTIGTAVNGITLITSDDPSNALFIQGTVSATDWRITQDNNLWISESSVNNPCPLGFKVPTVNDYFLLVEKAVIGNSSTAANSILKLTVPGYRYHMGGVFSQVDIKGYYSTSSISPTSNLPLARYISNTETYNTTPNRMHATSVRCIKN